MSEHRDRGWTTDIGPFCAECHADFPCKPYLTTQLAEMTSERDIAVATKKRAYQTLRDNAHTVIDLRTHARAAEHRIRELQDVVLAAEAVMGDMSNDTRWLELADAIDRAAPTEDEGPVAT